MKKNNLHTQGPIAEFIFEDGVYRRYEYPDQPIGLSRVVNKKFVRPISLKFYPPGEDWEASRLAEDRPVNQAFLERWKDRCRAAISKGKQE